MIDIHCHLLYGVDDGAKTIEESVAMLEAAKEQGISAMILTPHYRHGMFAYPKEEIEEHFRILEPYAQKLGLYRTLQGNIQQDASGTEPCKNVGETGADRGGRRRYLGLAFEVSSLSA